MIHESLFFFISKYDSSSISSRQCSSDPLQFVCSPDIKPDPEQEDASKKPGVDHASHAGLVWSIYRCSLSNKTLQVCVVEQLHQLLGHVRFMVMLSLNLMNHINKMLQFRFILTDQQVCLLGKICLKRSFALLRRPRR